MKRIIPFLLLSLGIGSSFLITGCENKSSGEEGSLTAVDNSVKAGVVRELNSSTDIGDVYNSIGVDYENEYDVDSIEKKMTGLAMANAGTDSADGLTKHLIVAPTEMDMELLFDVDTSAIFLEGGIYTNVSQFAVWSSEDPDIADVYQGEVHAKKVGETNINVTYRDITKSIHVNVVEKTNWEEKDGYWYYYDANGKKTTGWKVIDGNWYYLSNNGSMLTGWQKIKDGYYYFHSNGTMAQGEWAQNPDNNEWYYFNYNGKMAMRKWIKDGNNTYYVHSNGTMATNEWVPNDDGSWYYMLLDGKMARDRSIDIKGVSYQFDKEGKCLNPEGN